MNEQTEFGDLSAYEYHLFGLTLPGVVNVGWVDPRMSFSSGSVEPGLVEKLVLLRAKHPVNIMRGIRQCPSCLNEFETAAFGREELTLGIAELWIPGSKVIFAATDLIIHFITRHHYRPPNEFQSAAMAFDPDSPWDGNVIRDQLYKKELHSSGSA